MIKNMLLALAFIITLVIQHAAAMPCLSQGPQQVEDQHLNAMIYRGTNGCEGCSESIQALIQSAYPGINVTFAGADEDVKINADTLRDMDMFLQPGGPGQYHPASHVVFDSETIQILMRRGKRQNHMPLMYATSLLAVAGTLDSA